MSNCDKPSFEPNETKEKSSFEKQKETFEKYFLEGNILQVSLDGIPDKALEKFEESSKSLIQPEAYRPRNFDHAYLIEYPDGTKTYVVDQIKEFPSAGLKERSHYLMDLDEEGEFIGRGEIRWTTSSKEKYSKNKPFVGWAKTEDRFQKRGHASRRLAIMNALSQMEYGFPLNSDTLLSKEARSLWSKLVEQGKAKVYKEIGGIERFVFLP